MFSNGSTLVRFRAHLPVDRTRVRAKTVYNTIVSNLCNLRLRLRQSLQVMWWARIAQIWLKGYIVDTSFIFECIQKSLNNIVKLCCKQLISVSGTISGNYSARLPKGLRKMTSGIFHVELDRTSGSLEFILN